MSKIFFLFCGLFFSFIVGPVLYEYWDASLGIISSFDDDGDGLYDNYDTTWILHVVENNVKLLQAIVTSMDVPSDDICSIDYLKVGC